MNLFLVIFAVIGGMFTIGAIVGAIESLCQMHDDLLTNRAEHEKIGLEISRLWNEIEVIRAKQKATNVPQDCWKVTWTGGEQTVTNTTENCTFTPVRDTMTGKVSDDDA